MHDASITMFAPNSSPIGVGSDVAACAHVTNSGDRQARFNIIFTDVLPSGETITIGEERSLGLEPGQTKIICVTYPDVQEAGLHILSIAVSAHNKQLAVETAELTVE